MEEQIVRNFLIFFGWGEIYASEQTTPRFHQIKDKRGVIELPTQTPHPTHPEP